MASLGDPLSAVLTGKTVRLLKDTFAMATVGDLVSHYPRSYTRRGELTDLATLRPDDLVTIVARVRSVKNASYQDKRTGHRRYRAEVVVTDGTGELLLTFFSKRPHSFGLRAGQIGLFSGRVGVFQGRRQLTHPQMELLPESAAAEAGERAAQFADRLVPVYPAGKNLSSLDIQRALDRALPALDEVPDPLPADLRRRHGLVSADEALRTIHAPRDEAAVAAARHRLIVDEAMVVQTALARRKAQAEHLLATPRPAADRGIAVRFDERLPFPLTPGQRRVGADIAARLGGAAPMHLLLQGDVGTGKTLVALRAMLQVVAAGGQAVLLAPTEVLAQQHHAAITGLLGDLADGGFLGGAEEATRVALLTGSTPAAARRAALLDIVSGAAGIVVGTHALLTESVTYHDLGLIVVDEQHRFGVDQRSTLLERIPGQRPHLLVMTATPIPRSVAMTVFGDLDVVALTDRPTGEPDIVSHVVSETEAPGHLERAWERAGEEVAAGRQVFVVCPRIDADADEPPPVPVIPAAEDDGDPVAPAPPTHAVEDLAAELSAGPLRDVRVGVLHGRLSPEEKADVMRRFAAGPGAADGLDVLVSTTVIEVGVDIPAAGMMIVMDAERFGVSQLHQLRGRIGRDGRSALCLFVTTARTADPAFERLTAVAATLDGFELAQLDLQLRREGDVLGAAQSGSRSSLRLLSVLRHEDVIAMAREEAGALVAADPDLSGHPELRAAVDRLERQAEAEYLERS